MEQKTQKDNSIVKVIKNIFLKDIKYKVFAIIGGFLFWLFMSISI